MMLSPRLISPSTNSTPGKKRRNLRGSPHLIKRRKLRSEIWEDFEPIYDGEIVAEARCLHCHKLFKVNRDVGTSACLRHMRSCEGKTRMNQMLVQMNSGNMPLPENWKFDQARSRKELVKLIVVHSLPFSLVEYPKFRSFVSSLNPWFDHVSRTTIKENCVETYECGKKKLQNFLNGEEEETVPVDIEFDILEYWKMSSATYPVLARMARDILAIPASTVASESAFSSGEKIINEYRSRLTSDTVEALVCLQDWLRGSTSPHDIAGCIMGDEEDDEL